MNIRTGVSAQPERVSQKGRSWYKRSLWTSEQQGVTVTHPKKPWREVLKTCEWQQVAISCLQSQQPSEKSRGGSCPFGSPLVEQKMVIGLGEGGPGLGKLSLHTSHGHGALNSVRLQAPGMTGRAGVKDTPPWPHCVPSFPTARNQTWPACVVPSHGCRQGRLPHLSLLP